MGLSIETIKKILFNNQLIRGRLDLDISDIQKIYHLQCQERKKIRKKMDKYEKIIDASFNEMRILRVRLKYYEETLKKAFDPTAENISLLYKKSGKHHYIKARFYWKGHQREVQVGSIASVIANIRLMMETGYLEKKILPNIDKITWNELIKNTTLFIATKKIASLKFQEYVLRKISYKEENKLDCNIEDSKDIYKDVDSINIPKVKDDRYSWYEKWRNKNL